MKVLLDTHALLWFVLNDVHLSSNGRSAIADPRNDVLVSPASLWEIAIKISLGKYTLPEDFGTFVERELAENELDLLPITVRHLATVAKLPFHHRDPFDRPLIAQAMTEQVPLVSGDSALDKYPITPVW